MDNFKKRTLEIASEIKKEKLPIKLPIKDKNNKIIAFLRPVTKNTLSNKKEVSLLAKWRRENSFAFPSQFKVTVGGTKRWLENQLINNKTRILFFVESNFKKPKLIGHMGLYSFDFVDKSCEIDNVVRGEKFFLKGVMTPALKTLIKWTKKNLDPKNIYLRVFSDNERAIKFYGKCGFIKNKLLPLKKLVKPGVTLWSQDNRLKTADRYFIKMAYKT